MNYGSINLVGLSIKESERAEIVHVKSRITELLKTRSTQEIE